MNKKPILNDKIYHKTVRLIGDNIEPEIMSINKARQIQKETLLDLLLVTSDANPPVVKLCDYNKEIYKKSKAQKQAKKTVLKEVRISPNISNGDLETKMKKIKEFLSKKNKVKITMLFKGRAIYHKEIGERLLLSLIVDLEDIAKPDNMPKLIGKSMNVILSPK